MRDPMTMFGSQRAPVNPAKPLPWQRGQRTSRQSNCTGQERQIRFAGSAGTPLQCDSVTHGGDTSAMLWAPST